MLIVYWNRNKVYDYEKLFTIVRDIFAFCTWHISWIVVFCFHSTCIIHLYRGKCCVYYFAILYAKNTGFWTLNLPLRTSHICAIIDSPSNSRILHIAWQMFANNTCVDYHVDEQLSVCKQWAIFVLPTNLYYKKSMQVFSHGLVFALDGTIFASAIV